MVFRPEPGVDLVIPERLVPAFVYIVQAGRRGPAAAYVNVLMDGLEQTRGRPTRPGCADATTPDAESNLDVGQLLSVAQAARVVGCSPQRIRRLCGEQRLPAVKIAGVWMIRPADLDEYRFRRTDHG